jgi:hypothetical protein
MDDRLREPLSRPGEPTNAPPGSPRKIRVLMERAARREPLFHPLDGRTGRHPPPEPPGPEQADVPVSGSENAEEPVPAATE